MEKMKEHEQPNERGYIDQLHKVLHFLSKENEPSLIEIVQELGTRETALYSVPTALYCFLRSEMPKIKNSVSTHPFRTALEYAINLGGDTDTIASMACAISGAYYGVEMISNNCIRHCEDNENITRMADELFEKTVKQN